MFVGLAARFVAQERFDPGDLADDVGAFIEDGGAAAAGRPIGADVEPLVGGIVRGTAGPGVEAIDDAVAEVAPLAAWIAETVGGVADTGIDREREWNAGP